MYTFSIHTFTVGYHLIQSVGDTYNLYSATQRFFLAERNSYLLRVM